MTVFLTVEEALAVARSVIGAPPEVRDLGLVESAVARPRASAFGADAYATLDEKAAALLQSIVRDRPLVDGNERMGFGCTAVFLHINGHPLELDQDTAYDLVIAVATGGLAEVADIAAALRGWRTGEPSD
ncbi:death-on-curing protein [Mumia flava]|uniref:Death-on-curing protein n=1 Tax=Mumia flava TaxID=1348852 RepID=A0A0B2BN55_9ACTN|nr:Fic family protein [Mumia flava]PJJ57921.1 death-on-curing protein [Mumia flava]